MVPLLLSVVVSVSATSTPAETPPMAAPLVAIQKEMRAAKQKNAQMAWAFAFHKGAAFLHSRGEYEAAVEWFARETWPEQDRPFAFTSISRFQALSAYASMFHWELSRREPREDWRKQPIRQWSREQIIQVQNETLQKAWARRTHLGKADVRKLGAFSKEVFAGAEGRKDQSLRGALSLLWADFLRNPSSWNAQEQNESRAVPEEDLVALKTQGNPADTQAHPLLRSAWLYEELHHWHKQNGRVEEASETLRLHLVGLHSASIQKRYAALETQRALVEGKPEWAKVQAQLAHWLLQMGEPAQSHAVLQACVQAGLPGTGTAWCKEQLKNLLQRELSVHSRMHHAPGSAVLEVRLRNVPTLYFRAYHVLDLPNALNEVENSEKRHTLTAVLSKNKWIRPLKTWSTQVPNKGDFRTQELKITPELPGKGAYWLLVSDTNTFVPEKDNIHSMLLIQTELALVVNELKGGWEAVVVNAHTGKPEAGVAIRAGNNPPQTTNSEGKAAVQAGTSFWASRGEDMAVAHLENWHRDAHRGDTALVSLDRALYRPGQTLSFKAVLVRPGELAFSPLAQQKLHVALRDTNGREMAAHSLETNAFGSVAGEFKLPESGLLGNWQLLVSGERGHYLGGAYVAVEEYKRPTFEARFLEKQEAMHLNAPIKLVGEAKYYFGQPLPQGQVRWQVQRVPRWLRWWWESAPSAQTIAQGETTVGPDGRFEIEFVAQADAALQGEVAYFYSLTGDVLDEGGETQPISHSFHLGTRALHPVFQLQGAPFFAADKKITLPVFNRNLNGVGQKGKGTWKLYALNPQAPRTLGGHGVSPSVASAFHVDWQTQLRTWGEGGVEKQGEVVLDESGKGEVALGQLQRGAFRVVFETRDAFGNPCQAEANLLVVDTHLGMPFELFAQLEKEEVQVGEEVKLFLASQHKGLPLYVELFKKDTRLAAQWFVATDALQTFKWRVREEDRGGLHFRILSVQAFDVRELSRPVAVPWDNKELALSFAHFRDTLRPGEKERFVLTVTHKGKPLGKGEAEVLGLMYDKSLDALRQHAVPTAWNLYQQHGVFWMPRSTSLQTHVRQRWWRMPMPMAMAEAAPDEQPSGMHRERAVMKSPAPGEPAATPLRENFSETAFFLPFLTTDAKGQVAMHFEMPDSLTSWNVMASAHNTLGQASPVLTRETKTAKELMVRPYLPRFLREGDEATLAVVVNNMSDKALSGELELTLFEPETHAPLNPSFGLLQPRKAFHVPPQGLSKLEFVLKTPRKLGVVAVKAVAKAGAFSDGEQRLLPILPSRMHLAQSRFVALKGKQEKALHFADMAKADNTRINERLAITLDGQLLTGALEALPYLATYPYECTEQTFNRFFSAGMLASLFRQNPELSALADKLAQKRTTPLARFDGEDANRKLALEETPFLPRARGGEWPAWVQALNLLEPRVAQKQADSAWAKLQRAQNADGGFPWFAGGRSSTYITSYLLIGFARAQEFGMPIPPEVARRAWAFLKWHVEGELKKCMEKGACVEEVVLTNYAASLFEASVTGIGKEQQQALLAYATSKRKQLAPRLRVLTALTLHHMGESRRAKEWLESWMELSRETENEGRFWAPESMSWVWYNDSLENHAFTLHALNTLSPGDARAQGLVQWIFLNKKLSHWRSTRTTAEVLYALVGYLKSQNLLHQTERVEVRVGAEQKEFVFEPSNLETGKQQWVFKGEEIRPQTMGRIGLKQKTDGLNFASATWHFSTEQLPEKGDGDLFRVSRAYFKRVVDANGFKLIPLRSGEAVRLGEEVEVQLTVETKAPAEYVHLRDVRAAGLEPRSTASGWKWEKGYGCYEEVRDSAQNYFFEHLPKGTFQFSYRLVASMLGSFQLGPAVVQSIYAPEFAGYSAGYVLKVVP